MDGLTDGWMDGLYGRGLGHNGRDQGRRLGEDDPINAALTEASSPTWLALVIMAVLALGYYVLAWYFGQVSRLKATSED